MKGLEAMQFEEGGVIVIEVIQADDFMALVEEEAGCMTADEAGCAGN